jgi:acid stress chaperone HdeB
LPNGRKLTRKFLVGVVIFLSFSTLALAEDKMVVDMSKLTCRELTKLGFQDFAGITMWLSGYYSSTVIDLNEFGQAAKTVKDFCQTSPQSTVMAASERALGIKMPRAR